MARVLTSLGKRGRESSAEQWRKLARTAPATLLRVATSESDEVLERLASAYRRLRRLTAAKLLLQACGSSAGPRGSPPRRLRGRSADRARRAVERLAALHGGAGHVLAHCAARLVLLDQGSGGGDDAAAATGARWRAWHGRRAEAAGHADEALLRLRSARADLGAAAHVVCAVCRWPPESPSRAAWAAEAERLLRHAADEAAAAHGAVLRMRDAVFLEFFDAWKVLSR